MRKINPLISWLAGLAALAVLALTLQPAIDAQAARLAAWQSDAASPQSAINLELRNDLSQALPVKVDASVDGPSSLEAVTAANVLKLINAERAKVGLKKLSLAGKLNSASSGHSKDMAKKNYFSHTGSNGSSFTDRIDKTGYKWSAAGENIYAGNGPYNNAKQCVQAWMNSAGHREIMLSTAYTQVGIGYAFNAKSTYGGYFTADFGKPR